MAIHSNAVVVLALPFLPRISPGMGQVSFFCLGLCGRLLRMQLGAFVRRYVAKVRPKPISFRFGPSLYARKTHALLNR